MASKWYDDPSYNCYSVCVLNPTEFYWIVGHYEPMKNGSKKLVVTASGYATTEAKALDDARIAAGTKAIKDWSLLAENHLRCLHGLPPATDQ